MQVQLRAKSVTSFSPSLKVTSSQVLNSIIKELKELGVEVNSDRDLSDKGFTGVYDPNKGVLYNPSLLSRYRFDELLETIAHEAVHVAQYSLGNNNYRPLGIQVSYSAIERVNESPAYDNDSDLELLLEYEAFTLETKPTEVLNLLRQMNCKRRLSYILQD